MRIYISVVFCIINSGYCMDWCALNCNRGEHIACTLKGDCSVTEPCTFMTLNKEKILKSHNALRAKFANGKEPKTSGLTVANMRSLRWDGDLAFTASCNVGRCLLMEHDFCRGSPEYPAAGQNLWQVQFAGEGDCGSKYAEATRLWYDEISLLNKDQIKEMASAYQAIQGTGHFTQIIWAETEAIGCAMTQKKEEGNTICNLACNYGPAGNVDTGEMLAEGAPCSMCPEGTRCGDGLCGSAVKYYPILTIYAMVLFLIILNVL
ncbi:venom allergen 5-like [Sitophilus oryzae]|uniref:Venom allergen 5-like n=1 Tax=Sitophilus oryzae TaxID=7048 RepID=A0A6J2XBL6_SITOR|nr:venom allergen 5-like [Sitophilus oryzae]